MFRANLSHTENTVITLVDDSTGTTAEIFAFGALLNKFSVIKNNIAKNVVLGFASVEDAKQHITGAFQSAKLSPFVCRLKDGKFSFDGQQYTINKFFLKTEAIHGLVYDAPFKVVTHGANADAAYVTLEYDYKNSSDGFSFPYTVTVTYTLEKDNTLSVATSVINTGDCEMPLADGWHPYFTLGDTVNDLELQFNSSDIVVFDTRLLPTGALENYSAYNDFKKLGDSFFDNCFVVADFKKPACVIRDVAAGLQLAVLPEDSYPYLQIYTPADRKSIAIENLSSIPDAFNNKVGLITLDPGDTADFKTAYQVQFL